MLLELNLRLLWLLHLHVGDHSTAKAISSLSLSEVRLNFFSLIEVILTITFGRLFLAHVHCCKSHIALLIELCVLKVPSIILAVPIARLLISERLFFIVIQACSQVLEIFA